jgi:predicted dehydrogenase
MLKVGLIGAGWVTQHHLSAWKELSGRAAIVAVADPSEENRSRRAQEFGIPVSYESAQAMLDACDLDAVDIAAPRAVHADLVRLASDKGLAVLCQKPLAPTLHEAEQLVADVGSRIRLMVHENWRFRAWYRQAAKWIREGAIGDVTAASLSLMTSGTLPDENGRFPAFIRQPFMQTESRMLVAEVLIHHLDTLRMLLGPLQVRAASLTQTCPHMAGEDGAVIHLSTQEGAGVSVVASFAAKGQPTALTDKLVIIGRKGAIQFDGSELTLHADSTERLSFDPAVVYAGSYASAIGHFVDCLRNDTPFETSAADNLDTLRLVDDCYSLAEHASSARRRTG